MFKRIYFEYNYIYQAWGNMWEKYMEEEYSKYLISKLFSDYEYNYEYEIMSYGEFMTEQNYYAHTEGENEDE